MAKGNIRKNLVLGLETSTHSGGAALLMPGSGPGAVDASLVGSVCFSTRELYSQRLLPSIEWLLERTQITMADVSTVGISIGPGSFTGLRIGLSVAKALAYASGAKMVGVGTLEALAVRAAGEREMQVCPMLDARHGQVYAGLYHVEWRDGLPEVHERRAAWAGPAEEIADWIDEPTIFAGDALSLAHEKLGPALGDKFMPAAIERRLPHPEAVAALTASRARVGLFDDPVGLEPQYVRQSYTATKPASA